MSKLINEVFDYTSVDTKVKKNVKALLKSIHNGYELIMISKFSKFEGDKHTYLVMGKGGYRNGYATWIYNSITNNLYDGHYDLDFKVAVMDFSSRLI